MDYILSLLIVSLFLLSVVDYILRRFPIKPQYEVIIALCECSAVFLLLLFLFSSEKMLQPEVFWIILLAYLTYERIKKILHKNNCRQKLITYFFFVVLFLVALLITIPGVLSARRYLIHLFPILKISIYL